MFKNNLLLIIGLSLFAPSLRGDLVPNTIIGSVLDPRNTFSRPNAIAITPDGNTAYVANLLSISIVDLKSDRVIGTVLDPKHILETIVAIAITPDGKKAYVLNSGGDTVAIIDITTNTATGFVTPDTFVSSQGIAITPDGTKAYVTNSSTNSVSIIDVATDKVVGTVNDPMSTFIGPLYIAITPDGSTAYVTNQSAFGSISIINVQTNTVTGIVSDPFHLASGNSAGIAITPDGSKAYITNLSPASLGIVDLNTNTALTPITSGLTPSLIALAIAPNGSAVYLGSGQPAVPIVNVQTDTISGTVADPLNTLKPLDEILSIAITPNGAKGYIANHTDSSVEIIFIAAPLAPASVTASKTCNSFLAQTDAINSISWTAPTSGVSPTEYTIYRDAALTERIATIAADSPLQYCDHNRNPNCTYSYFIVSVDQYGTASEPNSVTI